MKMKDKKKLENAVTSREYKCIIKYIAPYEDECGCKIRLWYWNKRKTGVIFRPFHNKAGHCRLGNSHKSWKNYRKKQYRESLK